MWRSPAGKLSTRKLSIVQGIFTFGISRRNELLDVTSASNTVEPCSSEAEGNAPISKLVWCHQNIHPCAWSLVPEWHEWIVRQFSNIVWYLSWEHSLSTQHLLTRSYSGSGIAMLQHLQSLKSEVTLWHGQANSDILMALSKNTNRLRSLSLFLHTHTHTHMCINIYAQLENCRSLLKCKSSDVMWKKFNVEKGSKTQLSSKSIEIFLLISVKQRFSLPVLKVVNGWQNQTIFLSFFYHIISF